MGCDTVRNTIIFAAVNAPLTFMFRQYGVDHWHFLIHDDDLSSGNLEAGRSELEILLEKINRATALDRQIARADAREWLLKHEEHLTPNDLVFVRENFGYLLPGSFGK